MYPFTTMHHLYGELVTLMMLVCGGVYPFTTVHHLYGELVTYMMLVCGGVYPFTMCTICMVN